VSSDETLGTASLPATTSSSTENSVITNSSGITISKSLPSYVKEDPVGNYFNTTTA
jgi:hypothetical protein